MAKGKIRQMRRRSRQKQSNKSKSDDELLARETEAFDLASEALGFECHYSLYHGKRAEMWTGQSSFFSPALRIRVGSCNKGLHYHSFSINEIRRLAEILAFETSDPDHALELLLVNLDYLHERRV